MLGKVRRPSGGAPSTGATEAARDGGHRGRAVPGRRSLGDRARSALAHMGVPFFLVACTLAYYGQLHRAQTGDAYGTIYVAVALVEQQTVFLDDYLPYIQARAGEAPYMLTIGADGRVANGPPLATSLLALPVVAAFSLAGVEAADFDTWMEAGMLTSALVGAATAALLFLLLTRLTTRRRAALITSIYAFGTLAWGINGQGLWQHGGAALALVLTLLFLADRRYVLAGPAMLAMVALRPSTPVIAACLLPLLGRRPANWARFALGAVPIVAALALANWATFSSAVEQGYGSRHVADSLTPKSPLTVVEGAGTLLFSPGRGLFFYSPVLLFAVAGAVIGLRRPIYRWCAVAALVYPLAIGNLSQWSGNESFGGRKLAEALPLFAVLLVPALDAIVRRARLRSLFALLAAWSVAIQVLGAAAWPPPTWFGEHDLQATGTWWSIADNEVVAMLQESGTAPRVLAMVGLLAGAALLGLLVSGWRPDRLPRRPRPVRA